MPNHKITFPLQRRLAICCVAGSLAISGCTGVGSIDSAESLGLSAVPQNTSVPLPAPAVADAAQTIATEPQASTAAKELPADDDLYSGLPTGPNDTGQYPTFSAQPAARIVDPYDNEVSRLTAELEALEKAQSAGAVSPSTYKKRLAALKRLAANHSPAMLRRIESRQSNPCPQGQTCDN